MSRKRKKDSAQPELPIPEAPDTSPGEVHAAPVPANPDASKPETNAPAGEGDGAGNGQTHVLAENVAHQAPSRPFVPGKIELPLHRRVDRSFLDYASYVIRDRAIPNLADGLKPVQRRILWALHEMDDGRFMKVANVVGDTMQVPSARRRLDRRRAGGAGQQALPHRGPGQFWQHLHRRPAGGAALYRVPADASWPATELFNDEITEFVPSYDGRKQGARHAARASCRCCSCSAPKASRSACPRAFCRTISLSCSRRKSPFSRSSRSSACPISRPAA